MFESVSTKLRLSQAAVVVQKLLVDYGTGAKVASAAASTSHRLVQRAHWECPELLEGKNGRIHKLAVAAVALAWGLKDGCEGPEMRQAMSLALDALLLDIVENPQEYALSGQDYKLLAIAQDEYAVEAA